MSAKFCQHFLFFPSQTWINFNAPHEALFLLFPSPSHLLFASTGTFIFISIVQLNGAIKIVLFPISLFFMIHEKVLLVFADCPGGYQEFLADKKRNTVNHPLLNFPRGKTGKFFDIFGWLQPSREKRVSAAHRTKTTNFCLKWRRWSNVFLLGSEIYWGNYGNML